jgi:hypothetical protein
VPNHAPGASAGREPHRRESRHARWRSRVWVRRPSVDHRIETVRRCHLHDWPTTYRPAVQSISRRDPARCAARGMVATSQPRCGPGEPGWGARRHGPRYRPRTCNTCFWSGRSSWMTISSPLLRCRRHAARHHRLGRRASSGTPAGFVFEITRRRPIGFGARNLVGAI